MGVSSTIVSKERAAIEAIEVRPTNNRSVLGSMNDFAFHLKSEVGSRFYDDKADSLEDMLSHIPMSALKYEYPVEAAARLFAVNRELVNRAGFWPF